METYNRGSGQLVNKDKSAIFFSSNCDERVKQEFRHELHIETEALSDKYLGLPTPVGRSSTEAFDFMQQESKIWLVLGVVGKRAVLAGRYFLNLWLK